MAIPDGMTKAQFYVLMLCVVGKGSRIQSSNIARAFQLDEAQFELQMSILRQAGLITVDFKLTGDGKRVFEGKESFRDLIAKQKNLQSLQAELLAASAQPTTSLIVANMAKNPSVTLLRCPSCNAPLDFSTASNESVKCLFCGETVQVHD